MISFILWYTTTTLLGLLTFPLAHRLFPALADRGYALSRALGLLLWGFIFWLAVSLGIAQNNTGGLLLSLAGLAALSGWALWRLDSSKLKVESSDSKQPSTFNLQPVSNWIKTNLNYVIIVEAIFLVAFAAWAFVRANNPESVGTEKPMEIAFINAILRSPTFPPHDPWLSGYGISYYYFGYVMAAMLAKFTATSGGVAFNLMLALVFGLSAIGAYGLLFNLLNAYWTEDERRTTEDEPRSTVFGLRSALAAFLAPLFLIILGNWEGFLEVLHRRGIGWTFNADGSATSSFWAWLKMLDLSDAPVSITNSLFGRLGYWLNTNGIKGLGDWIGEQFMPDRFWWWWRASRVVHDYDLRGAWLEIIDEFPFFSYLLGDLHPHVLAMPFGLLAAALALNLYLGGFKGETNLFGLKLPVRREAFVLLAVMLGGLAFLNTWDFPIYLAIICGALILALVQERGWDWKLLEDFLKFSIPLGMLSIALYLPFYVSFSSQAGGIIPNVVFPTRGAYLWIMFGGMFVPMLAFLAFLRGKQGANWKVGLLLAGGVTLLLWALSSALGVFAAQMEVGQSFISSQGLSSAGDVLYEATLRRLAYGAGLGTLLLLIGGAAAYLTAKKAPALEEGAEEPVSERSPIPFVLMFILFGGLLVLAPDFVILRDQFGWRINTVFKFYYQAWALWSLAAAFAVAVMLSELRGRLGAVYTVVMVAVIGMGLVYPVLSVPNKTNNFNPGGGRTLDAAAHLSMYSPDDYAAIQFMTQAEPGVVVEAVGGSYSEYARVATYSGQPTVLGWPGHESQWRGGSQEMGSRDVDIRTLYTTSSWEQAQAILQQYDIRYVYIGDLERRSYNVNETKFARHLKEIYRQGQVVIYAVP